MSLCSTATASQLLNGSTGARFGIHKVQHRLTQVVFQDSLQPAACPTARGMAFHMFGLTGKWTLDFARSCKFQPTSKERALLSRCQAPFLWLLGLNTKTSMDISRADNVRHSETISVNPCIGWMHIKPIPLILNGPQHGTPIHGCIQYGVTVS